MSSQNPKFFKTGVGEYAEHDKFLGWTVPEVRKMAKEQYHLSFKEISTLLDSPYNEKRFLALVILVHQYQKTAYKDEIYAFYLKHKHRVNNWNLVDASAHLIVGAHLLNQKDKSILQTLAASENLWDRRIAMVATWYFIRHEQYEWTYKIAKQLLNDDQDLIHKATGWMLREAGKKDKASLNQFLDCHAARMPRTTLRYAIEKFDAKERAAYLSIPRQLNA